jgi:hypothetical protein
MNIDTEKLDLDVLALLYLTAFREREDLPWRTWKGHDWEVLDRLHQKGLISDPKSKSKSVALSEEGYQTAKELFEAKYDRVC